MFLASSSDCIQIKKEFLQEISLILEEELYSWVRFSKLFPKWHLSYCYVLRERELN